MTRISKAVCDALGDDTGFIKGLHCQCNLDKENKYIVHFPQDNTIISMNSNYGGNVLGARSASPCALPPTSAGRRAGWRSICSSSASRIPRRDQVHLRRLPLRLRQDEPAMLIPPEGLQRWGWRVWCVGDDIAWLRIGKDGRLWAVNPENGFFGVAPGTSMKSTRTPSSPRIRTPSSPTSPST